MGAVLQRIDDPRDDLERARRTELVKFARANGINEIPIGNAVIPVADAPAKLTRVVLRSKGLVRIQIPKRVLGTPQGSVQPPSDAPDVPADAIDEVADLARQIAAQPVPIRKTPAQMSINELGAEMKRLNIKRDRRDNMLTMRAKIEQHGQDAS